MLLKIKVRGKAAENAVVCKMKEDPVYRSTQEGPGVSRIEQISGSCEFIRVTLTASAYDDEALKIFLAEFFSLPLERVKLIYRGPSPEIDAAAGLPIETTREMTVEIIGRSEEELKRVMDSIP